MRELSTFPPVSLPRQANQSTAMLSSANIAHPSSKTVSRDALFLGAAAGPVGGTGDCQ
jgi:hypothetical protein